VIGQQLIIFLAPAHRLGAVAFEVCPKSFPTIQTSIFPFLARFILLMGTTPGVRFSVFRTHQKSSKQHSKLSGISNTASFK
jgi:hypothetical protein